MCIAILTTTHPTYRFIILNNRDEFLSRPTAPVRWWSSRSPDSFTNTTATSLPVLSARDLARPAHGTWLGINKIGRVGVLTNCLETDCARAVGARSRGSVIKDWLTSCPSSERIGGQDKDGNVKGQGSIEEFVSSLADLGDVGGFNLLIGDVRETEHGRGLAIISNRSAGGSLASDSARLSGYCAPSGEAREQLQVRWVDWGGIESGTGETIALSNMTLGDDDHQLKWKKVSQGEKLTAEAVAASLRAGDSEDALVERLFDVLSTDTLPRLPGGLEESAEAYLGLLRAGKYLYSSHWEGSAASERKESNRVEPVTYGGPLWHADADSNVDRA
ncbi:hypothetical protein ASPSYDRAFT_35285 [Aspergillus sydowii CBS 593.65]|uniref:DUF833 domain-containing protein n=1 Tax=Aspergillus sydowii CBS 593.65 TaxID=1036612 RepID=A0A1L9T5M8_9EURO|nr:uncharacterized protein ASPSYDRAFT_35285 [Aspergillus sydowii CBS 593.65]OJJ54593.1 hypothetical protein ASPSYDRAFT_35285 [Aspergillus sydowii CBS 593.65]